jgi:prophage regulatory protein
MVTTTNTLPKPEFSGFVRLAQIVGNPKANPPIPAIIPVSRSTFLNWVKSGKAPKPVKLGERTTAWRVDDIRALIEKLGETEAVGGAQ